MPARPSLRLPGVSLLWGGVAALSGLLVTLVLTALPLRTGVLLLAGIAALSVAVLGSRLTPAHIMCIGTASAMLSGNWSLLGSPIGLDRLIVLAGVLATMLAAARDPRVTLATRPVHLGLAVAAVTAIGSALVAHTLTTTVGLYALLDHFGLVPFLAFAVAPYAFRGTRDRMALVKTLVIMGAYLGATAVFERVGPHVLVFPRFILDPSVGLHADRARGPFLEASANGVVMVMCGIACWYGALHLGRRWRWACIAAGGLCTLGIALTLTRSAWIAGVVAGGLALGYSRRHRRYLLPAAAGLVAVVAMALLLLPGFAGSAQQRANDQSPVWDRQNLVVAATRVIDDKPLFGLGWGRFPLDGRAYFRQADTYPMQGEGLVVHNVPLLYAAEMGLAGAGIWLVAVTVALVGPMTRRLGPIMEDWQAAHLAIVAAWAIVSMFAPLAQMLPNLLVFLWAGITAGAVPWMSPLSARRQAAAARAGGPPHTPPDAAPAALASA
ncbi:MAG: O-antigen ligase family protein [Thermoleophilia bacterium]